MVAIPSISTLLYFIMLTLFQVPLWLSPFVAGFMGYKTVELYKQLIKEAAPGYLYHFFYTAGIINPTILVEENGKKIRKNPDSIPYGFETEFRD